MKRKGDHVMPFTDSHFLLALVGAERPADAEAYRQSLAEFAKTEGVDAAETTRNIGLPLADALCNFCEGRNAEAADKLYAIRHDLQPLGGSHAQQDVFHQIMVEAAMRAGRTDMARSLLNERMLLRPGSSWAPRRLQALNS